MGEGLVERVVGIRVIHVFGILGCWVLDDRIEQRLVQPFCYLIEDVVNVLRTSPGLLDGHDWHRRDDWDVLFWLW